MEQMKTVSAKRHKRANIQHLILESVALTGLLAVALVAPNVVGAMEKIGLVPRGRQDEYIRNARRRLKKDGLLVERDGFLRLTDRGTKKLQTFSARMIGNIPRKWDEKWRVLIFDIPERRRLSRDKVRYHLRRSGFIRAQDSVWIYPYPCEEFVALLKAECRVGKDMLYLIVDMIEGDSKYRKHFKLKDDDDQLIHIKGTSGKILDAILPEKKYD